MRYFGGKFRIAWWIVKHFPEHRTYVESFGGGGSVLMRKRRAGGECYNDLNGDIVNVFRVLRDSETCVALTRALELTPFARLEYEQAHEPAEDPVERARRTLVRSFQGFGSDFTDPTFTTGFRSDARDPNRVAAHEWATYPQAIPTFHARLQGFELIA
jgi:DNA adenine methylase